MIPPWTSLDDNDRGLFSAVVAFLKTRLVERDTIEWVLGLEANQQVERVAVAYLLDNPAGRELREPWSTAWLLIRESWSRPQGPDDTRDRLYTIGNRLRNGDRSKAIVAEITELVTPALELKPTPIASIPFAKKRHHPTKLHHLIWTSLTSGPLVDLKTLGLWDVAEVPFLRLLASHLEATVADGLNLGSYTGAHENPDVWPTQGLRRVRYEHLPPLTTSAQEPEAFHYGLGPAVKLLHAVVARIAELEPRSALPFVRSWAESPSPIHIRLWATSALDTALVSPEEVGRFLVGMDAYPFWDLYSFPEVAELRARRFAEINNQNQNEIISRLRRLPPTIWWRRKGAHEGSRRYWAFRELKRIELSGGELPTWVHSWLETGMAQFPKLRFMNIGDGFLKPSVVYRIHPTPDDQYDGLTGITRLRALEAALSSESRGLRSFMRAQDWLQQPNKPTAILEDLESLEDGGEEFATVWRHFGYMHTHKELSAETETQWENHREAERVLRLFHVLSARTLYAAIEGISNWLDEWREEVIASPLGISAWLRIWPIAAEATNLDEQRQADSDLNVSDPFDDPEPMYIDKCYTSAGRLVSVLLSACLSSGENAEVFAYGSIVRRMQEAVIGDIGRSGLIAKYRLIERLPFLLKADYDWTVQHLIPPLGQDHENLALWRAVARRTRTTDVLRVLGEKMAEKATDRRLDRQTRRSLANSVIRESVHAFGEKRQPAVPNHRVQQMLRSLDDEVRSGVAYGIREFLEETKDETAAAEQFQSAVQPFLQQVWPQERSLSTPRLSHFFAQVPAAAGRAFAQAVGVVERFLVPFECWSILHFGLDIHDHNVATPKLSLIDREDKAEAFLQLLDLTIGTSEGAAVPYDLADALARIHAVAPNLVRSQAYRRLATLARR